MSTENMKKRSEVEESRKWDLTRIFADEEEFNKTVKQIKNKSSQIVEKYRGKLDNPEVVLNCLQDYENLMIAGYHVYTYAHLSASVDETDQKRQERLNNIKMLFSQISSSTSFIESEIMELDNNLIEKTAEQTEDYKVYLQDLIRKKEYRLDPEVEKTLSALSPVLQAPQSIYNQTKLADLEFESFNVEGEEYPLSFVLFENEYQMEPDNEIRRTAFKKFSESLRDYQNTMAASYNTQLQKEKIISDMRGYDDIFEYLLFEQKVDRDLYDRQIDLIMEHLAPHMRRYAGLLKKVYGLDKMTYADLKIPLDPDFEPEVTVEKSKEYVA